jgi:very-short-patch-repair endonuclease
MAQRIDSSPYEDQCGVLTDDQALSLGLTPAALRWQLSSGRWQRPLPKVIITHSGRWTREQLIWAASLWGGDDAALAAATACELDGLKGQHDKRIHLVTPIAGGRTSRGFVVVHRSTVLAQDIHPTNVPRRTTPARSVIDLAMSRGRADDAVAVIAAAVQQRLVQPEQLGDLIARFRNGRHRATIISAIEDALGGSQSLPEMQALRAIRQAGLPEPSRQTVRMDGDRRRYLDLAWLAYRLCIEIDGAFHIDVETWIADMLRDAEISVDGVEVIRIPAAFVRRDPRRFADLVRRLLVSRGWTDPVWNRSP